MSLLEQIRRNIRAALDERTAALAEMDEVLAAAEARGDRTLSKAEELRFDRVREEVRAADADLVQLREREAELVAREEARAAADAIDRRFPAPNSGDIRVGGSGEYRSGGRSFFADAFASMIVGDPAATSRLSHDQEARAAIGTSAMVGLVPPQYLGDLYVEVARAGRPFANLCSALPLPEHGMTVNLSRITTGSSVAAQNGENTAVSETEMDDALLTIDVRTIAGQQNISRQLFERSQPDIDMVIFRDLAAAYAAELNRQCITGTGINGELRGVLNTSGIESVTYTDATPTVGELYPKLADAVQRVQSHVYRGPSHIVMHPRRWGWFQAALDSSSRPLVTPTAAGPSNATGLGISQGYGETAGYLLGLPVVTDASIPTNLGAGTNEDTILVVAASELFLWEQAGGSPFTLRFEDGGSGTLTVKLVAYGYSAFTAGRYPKASVAIGGTGLVAPTW